MGSRKTKKSVDGMEDPVLQEVRLFWEGEKADDERRNEGRRISGGPPGKLVPARDGTHRPGSS